MNITLAMAGAGGVLAGFFIALTIFFTGDPNSSRKSAMGITAMIALLAGATVGVVVVLLRDTGTAQPAPSLMIQSVAVAIAATVLASLVSLFIIRQLYLVTLGRPVKNSGNGMKSIGSRSGRLRY